MRQSSQTTEARSPGRTVPATCPQPSYCVWAMGLIMGVSTLLLAACGSDPTPRSSVSSPESAVSHDGYFGSTPRLDALPDGTKAAAATDPYEAHAALYIADRYPSAQACRTCHPVQYEEWAGSPHAYAQLSPVFNAMHGTILELTNGTNGDFCIRCHTPVGMALEEPLFTSNLNRHPTSREGITCIACHRVSQPYGKVSARRSLETGSIVDPIYGPLGGEELARVLADPQYKVTTTEDGRGRPVHTEAREFFQLVQPSFCGACHDVTLPNGFRLEEAFSEYKASPAAARGVSCQDCHMGVEPGVASGYAEGPAAVVGGVETRVRRHANHSFVGPDYSVVHPGIFPHNPDAEAIASLAEWLTFDHEAGWGTDEFEDALADREDEAGAVMEFPDHWSSADDRYDAREVLDHQFAHLERLTDARRTLLKNGYKIGEIERLSAKDGLSFRVEVKNGTDGHSVPTGFTAERIVFLRVTVKDATGQVVFVSGDLDPNGDLRDSHSLYVHNGEIPRDEQLFSLQSKFLTTNVRGGEREQVLAVNHSVDPLPFVRPETISSILTGRPRDARIHKFGIEPGGRRWATYEVKTEHLTGAGPYQAEIQLIAGMVPVNLLDAIKDVGFDYGLSARELAKRVVAGHLVLWERKLELTAP